MTFLSRIPFRKLQMIEETHLAGEEVEISWEHPGSEPEVESQSWKTEKKIKYRIQKGQMVIR